MKYIYNQDEISTRIFRFIYGCAMHDAILQRAFIGKKDWIVKVEDAKNHLQKYIDFILNNKFQSQDEHDSFFIEIANDICREGKSSRYFYTQKKGGNNQNLLNRR